MKSNEDDNGHLVPNLEFEETNDAMAISVRSKESNANSMSQSGQGRDPSNSTQKSNLMNQAEINVVDEPRVNTQTINPAAEPNSMTHPQKDHNRTTTRTTTRMTITAVNSTAILFHFGFS